MSQPKPRRVVNTLPQLENLIMDIAQSDLNRQMQHLISDYKKTGNEHFRLDAEALKAEFDSWWDAEDLEFVAPIELWLNEVYGPLG